MRDNDYPTAYHVTRSIAGLVDMPQVRHNIAHCLAEMNHTEAALDLFLEAIKHAPTAEGWSSVASCYAKESRYAEAVQAAEAALKINPEYRDAKWNASLAMLALRRWRRGWEWWDMAIGTKMRPLPKWLGTDLKPWHRERDAVLLITGEQGLGDEIMFGSMLDDVIRDLGDPSRLYLATEHRLVNLFMRSFPGIHAAPRDADGFRLPEGAPAPTHHIAFGSLGRFYRLADDAFPGRAYLQADPQRVAMYKALLDTFGPGKKVGINWEGGVPSTGMAQRSFEAIMWANAWKPGIEFVSLNHKDRDGRQAKRFYDITGIRLHHVPFVHSEDYEDTAALVDALDCVASVTTTVVHLAGALGKKALVYVPANPAWRYGLTGSRCVWYKSMRLFRPTETFIPGYGFLPFDDIRAAI